MRTRATLAEPAVAQLILRGALACGYKVPSAILAELCLDPGSEKTGTFIGTAEDVPCVVAIGFLPSSAFFLAATICLAYAERAPRDLVRLVGAALRGWLGENGHDHAHAINLQHTDRSYMRGFGHFGRASRIGSVIEFRFE